MENFEACMLVNYNLSTDQDSFETEESYHSEEFDDDNDFFFAVMFNQFASIKPFKILKFEK